MIGFNKEKNEVIVGEESEAYKSEILVNRINLLAVDEIKGEMEVSVKTRYSANMAKAKIKQDGDIIKVKLDKPQKAITPRTISSILRRRYSSRWRQNSMLTLVDKTSN